MMMMMRFVCVLLVALVGSRLVEADFSCECYANGRYNVEDTKGKCWDDEIDAIWGDGENLMSSCDGDGGVSEDLV